MTKRLARKLQAAAVAEAGASDQTRKRRRDAGEYFPLIFMRVISRRRSHLALILIPCLIATVFNSVFDGVTGAEIVRFSRRVSLPLLPTDGESAVSMQNGISDARYPSKSAFN